MIFMAYQVIEATCGVGRDRLERSWVPRRCPLRRNIIYVQWMKTYTLMEMLGLSKGYFTCLINYRSPSG